MERARITYRKEIPLPSGLRCLGHLGSVWCGDLVLYHYHKWDFCHGLGGNGSRLPSSQMFLCREVRSKAVLTFCKNNYFGDGVWIHMCPTYRCFWNKSLIKCFCWESCFINPVVLYDATSPMCLLSIYIVSSVYCLLLKLIKQTVFKSCYEKNEHQHVE